MMREHAKHIELRRTHRSIEALTFTPASRKAEGEAVTLGLQQILQFFAIAILSELVGVLMRWSSLWP